MKESLFNILAPYISGSHVLDLFSGSGSLGIEALSRGAESAVMVDRSRQSTAIISENLQLTHLNDKAKVVAADYADAVRQFSAKGLKFDMIFLDPPYNKNFIQDTLKIFKNNDIISDDSILVAEHHYSDILPKQEGKLILVRSDKHGETILSFYKVENSN